MDPTSSTQELVQSQRQLHTLEKETAIVMLAPSAVRRAIKGAKKMLRPSAAQELAAIQSLATDLKSCVHDLQNSANHSRQGIDATNSSIDDLRKELPEFHGALNHFRQEVAEKGSQSDMLHQALQAELEQLRSQAAEVRKDLTTFFQMELAGVRKDLGQQGEDLQGALVSMQVRIKEDAAAEIRKLQSDASAAHREVTSMVQQTAQKLKDEAGQISSALQAAQEDAADLRSEVHEACSAIEDQRREVDAHLSMRITEVQEQLERDFKVADANLHAEVATAAASDRYNVGVEMERLRADLVQVDSLRATIAQVQDRWELTSRAGSHEVVATLRIDHAFLHNFMPADYEFPLVASRCMVRLKPNRKA
eukprot:s326_g19.t1